MDIWMIMLVYFIGGIVTGFWYRREMAEHMYKRAMAIPDKERRKQALAGLPAAITIGIAVMMFSWPVFLGKRVYRKIRTRGQ